jgi:Putative polyhydroxyalkanoic acid system protein (PHA_gran_rgn)
MPMLTVVVPHRLGVDQAADRITSGVLQFQPTFGNVATIEKADWVDDTLMFTISFPGSRVEGTIAVTDDNATIEAALPWLLTPVAGKARRLIEQYAVALLADH